jgi:hypothetical protein
MTEAFLYATSVHRLRLRARRFGFAALLLGLLPTEVVVGHAQWLWQVVPARPPVGALAALAPALCGLALLVAAKWARRGVTLASTLTTVLVGTAAALHFGGSASAWEGLSLPPAVTERPVPAILALALSSAGVHLAFKPALRRASRGLLTAALACAAVFYLVPVRGESPGEALLGLVTHVGDLPHWRLQLGFVVLAVMLAYPGGMALGAQVFRRRTPTHEEPAFALAALYGLPVMFGMLLYRSLPFAGQGWPLALTAVQIGVLATLVALTSSLAEVLAEGYFTDAPAEAEAELPPGWPARRLAGLHGALGVLFVGGLALAARPPEKGVDWTLGPATPAAEALFAEALPAWNEARWRWDHRVRDESGAAALVDLKRAGKALTEAAAPLPEPVRAALASLLAESRTLDLAGRRWYALVGEVNEALRASGLPYYVDPTVYEYGADDGVRRHFRVRSYRVTRVSAQPLEGRDYAALHVTPIGPEATGDARLGFSRDVQPFALVVEAEIAAWADRLAAGRCGLDDAPDPAAPEAGPLAACAALVETLRAQPGFDLAAAIARMTERHELQHQVDGPELPMPTSVVRMTAGFGDRVRERVNRELSAYLAEMTTEGAPARLGLTHLLPFALNPGTAEHLVALLVFEGLTGRSLVEPVTGALDVENVGAAFETLAALDDAALAARAAALRDDWY